MCETASGRRFRRRSGASALGSARSRGGQCGFGRFQAVSDVSSCGRMREKARASDAGLRPRRAVRQLDGADDVVDRALEQQLRLAFDQARVANLAVAQHTLEVAEHAPSAGIRSFEISAFLDRFSAGRTG